MSDTNLFWQSITGKWNQLKQWCLWNVSGTPSGSIESSFWYDTDENRAAIKDDEKTQYLAHVEDLYNYTGVYTQPTITIGSGGVITVGSDGVMIAREDALFSGIPKRWTPAGATLSLAEGYDQWLVYTAGVGYSITAINPGTPGVLSNVVAVYRYIYEFGRVHSSTQEELARGQSEKQVIRTAYTTYYERVRNAGLILSINGLLVNISSAYVFNGVPIIHVLAFVGGTNPLYRHSVASNAWSESVVSGIDTSIYNPSTGIATLPTNKYAWAHVYRSIGDDIEAFVIYGDAYFSNEGSAIAGFALPSSVTATVYGHCVRVGSVLYQRGDTSIAPTRVYSAWTGAGAAGAGVTDHEALNNLLGGLPNDHYHLTAAQLLTYITNFSSSVLSTVLTGLSVATGGVPAVTDTILAAIGKLAYHVGLTNSNPHGTTAAQISNSPSGSISSMTVQAAINELDSEKVSSSELGNYVSKASTSLQKVVSVLEVENASIPLVGRRLSSATDTTANGVTAVHKTSGVSTAGFGAIVSMWVSDSTSPTAYEIAGLVGSRTKTGDLDTAANRSSNITLYNLNESGVYQEVITGNPDGTSTLAESPAVNSNDKHVATTGWVRGRLVNEFPSGGHFATETLSGADIIRTWFFRRTIFRVNRTDTTTRMLTIGLSELRDGWLYRFVLSYLGVGTGANSYNRFSLSGGTFKFSSGTGVEFTASEYMYLPGLATGNSALVKIDVVKDGSTVYVLVYS